MIYRGRVLQPKSMEPLGIPISHPREADRSSARSIGAARPTYKHKPVRTLILHRARSRRLRLGGATTEVPSSGRPLYHLHQRRSVDSWPARDHEHDTCPSNVVDRSVGEIQVPVGRADSCWNRGPAHYRRPVARGAPSLHIGFAIETGCEGGDPSYYRALNYHCTGLKWHGLHRDDTH